MGPAARRPEPAPTDRLLQRIGLSGPPAADADGLRAVVRAFIATVPFEALAAQLGESGPLDPPRLLDRVLHGGRGGYCFEVNTVLQVLLEDLGFRVERRAGIVGPRTAWAEGVAVNHLTLVVATADGPFIADAGLGDGPVEPLPLVAGRHPVGPLVFELAREEDGWWVGFPGHTSTPGFRFADTPAELSTFGEHHTRLSTAPDSGFVRTLVVQRPEPDRVVTLRARTLTVVGRGLRETRVLEDAAELAAVLRDVFGIDPGALGEDRLARLWALAVAQHERHVARPAATP